ncbi:MAG: DUF2948 family protein [Nitratireductor sp.]
MNRLKLIALDEEDLSVISAHVQDAVLKAGDIDYFAREKRFVVAMNRFVWEVADKTKQFERRRSVLHFERVNKVSSIGFNRKGKDQVLSLLAVVFQPGDLPAGTLELVFSGNAVIRLEVECVEAQLSDMAAAWETSSRPGHPDLEDNC